MTDEHRASDQLERALREWANAPPRTPAAEAARRVRARVTDGRWRASRAGRRARATTTQASRGLGWRRLALACVLVLAVAAAALLWRGPRPSPPVPSVTDAPPVLPENVVVFWLDAETPVYFVVSPVAGPPGETP
jgi:anti-sigma-K factor RskA